MKGQWSALIPFLLLAAPVGAAAAEQLIPGGSMVQCTVSEPKLSSKTADIGDPVLCHVSHVELYGRSVFPYGSYMEGRFEDYKDPGHLVGKGWMELKFDRMIIPPGQVIPIAAKVVYVPKYNVDKQGRIRGNGHPVRDAVEWAIPILWPIDLINLPRRGPRPVLKAETRLTLKIMEDLAIPSPQTYAYSAPYRPQYGEENRRDSYGFGQRAPMSYEQPAPMMAPPPQSRATQLQITVLMMRNGYARYATDYWFDGSQMRYTAPNGNSIILPADALDIPRTVEANRLRGVTFAMR